MNKQLNYPMFIAGLIIRLCLILCMNPIAITQWYAPFLEVSTSMITMDPWSLWIKVAGDPLAFPYGLAMWLAFIPFTLVAKLIGLPLIYAYYSTLIIADFCLLMMLNLLIPNRQRLILITYWLSPIIIIAIYGLGLNDLIPALLLFISIFFVKKLKMKLAGIWLALAISAKLSMVIALPFFAIYLFRNKSLRQCSPQFLISFLLSIFIIETPFLLSEDGVKMLLNNPEMSKIYQLTINLAENISIYIVPLIYLIMLYFVWKVQRFNFDLFQSNIGLNLLLIVLLSPASPGWFVWSLPFLVLYQAMSDRIAIFLVGIFSGTYLLSTLFVTHLQLANGYEFVLNDALPRIQLSDASSFLHTVMIAIGLVLAIRIWHDAIHRNDFFRLSRKPFVIGIAGDSGAGKDTFANSITGLFGTHSVVNLSGDNYHLWDRQKPMWQVMTHLNPMANNLERFANDLVSLTDGKNIMSRNYDHKTGKMSKPYRINSNNFIIASGLHALYLPALRECYNLKIYLDIDERLRRYFKLKRDTKQRGQTVEHVLATFDKREPDSKRFIRPQSKYADLILSLRPINSHILENYDEKTIRLKLVVITKNGLNELSMYRVLVGICGLHVDIINKDNAIEMTIEGETSADDIKMSAQTLCPHVIEFLDIAPKWHDDLLGIMQLITLSHINQMLTKRFI